MNLSSIHIDCNVYSSIPHTCVSNNVCGWCGEKNICVTGTSTWPPCLRSTYLFPASSLEWNPIKAGIINVLQLIREEMTSLTYEPEMNKLDVYKPYM